MRYKATKHKKHKRYFCEREEHCYCEQFNPSEEEYCMYCSLIIMKVARIEGVAENRVYMANKIHGEIIEI